MSFDGPALSFDDEGSILFDGEKIIVTVPVGHEALDHLGSEKEIPFPVVYTHPSHHQDQRPSGPPSPPGGNPVFNKEKARESVERARRARESARDEKSKSGKKDVKDDSPADRAPVTHKRDFQSDAIDEEPAPEAVWHENTPLTPGQQMHVDNLLSIETDNLAREVLITLKREGLPPNDQWREFLEQYALTGWYAASDAIAWATLAKIANSEWDETFAYADSAESVLLQDERESYIPLTPGQAHVVDGLLTQNIDGLAREALFALKQDGLPPENQWNEFMAQLEFPNGEETSDAQALLMLETVASSDWNQLVAKKDSAEPVLLQEERESYIPLTPGQAHVVDGLLTQNIDGLAREALFALKQDGLPPENQWNEFIAQLEFPNREETSDAQALLMLETVASSDWNQLVAKKDSAEPVLLQEEQSEAQEPQPTVVIEEADGGSLDIVGGIQRWDELEKFVNTDLAELQRLAAENPEFIRENMTLLEGIFGYNVEFHEGDFRIEEAKVKEIRLAMRQVFNIASSHYHIANAFGIEIMRKNANAINYYLGADAVIPGDQPQFRGNVPLPQSSTVGLENAYIGSEMTIGGITHETFHEIDRRFGGRLSVHYYYDVETKSYEGVGGLEWFLSTKVTNRYYGTPLGFNFGMVLHEDSKYVHLNEDSRASDEIVNQEIFPDVAAAVVFGLHDEDFFSKAFEDDEENRIGFASYNSFVKDLICGFHQYIEQVANGVSEPGDFRYESAKCMQ